MASFPAWEALFFPITTNSSAVAAGCTVTAYARTPWGETRNWLPHPDWFTLDGGRVVCGTPPDLPTHGTMHVCDAGPRPPAPGPILLMRTPNSAGSPSGTSVKVSANIPSTNAGVW